MHTSSCIKFMTLIYLPLGGKLEKVIILFLLFLFFSREGIHISDHNDIIFAKLPMYFQN